MLLGVVSARYSAVGCCGGGIVADTRAAMSSVVAHLSVFAPASVVRRGASRVHSSVTSAIDALSIAI